MRVVTFLKSSLTILLLFTFTSQVHAQWYTSRDNDEMTGDKSSYAHSPSVTANDRLDFPYNGTEANLSVGCDSDSEWAYISFSQEPNLTNTDTHDEYDEIDTRIKFDDQVQPVTLSQDWGSKFIHFYYDSGYIDKFMSSHTVLLELDWHGNGDVYFEFSLEGSADAIEKIRNQCDSY